MKKILIVLFWFIALSAFSQEEIITEDGLFMEIEIGYYKDSADFKAFTIETYDKFARRNFDYADDVKMEHQLVETVYPDTTYYMIRSKAILPNCNSMAVIFEKAEREDGAVYYFLRFD